MDAPVVAESSARGSAAHGNPTVSHGSPNPIGGRGTDHRPTRFAPTPPTGRGTARQPTRTAPTPPTGNDPDHRPTRFAPTPDGPAGAAGHGRTGPAPGLRVPAGSR